jgi:hypothetical protein
VSDLPIFKYTLGTCVGVSSESLVFARSTALAMLDADGDGYVEPGEADDRWEEAMSVAKTFERQRSATEILTPPIAQTGQGIVMLSRRSVGAGVTAIGGAATLVTGTAAMIKENDFSLSRGADVVATATYEIASSYVATRLGVGTGTITGAAASAPLTPLGGVVVGTVTGAAVAVGTKAGLDALKDAIVIAFSD